MLGLAKEQSDCMLAAAHTDTSPLELDCGPRTAVTTPPRGVPTQVILDSTQWASKCGDGSDYAFYLRLAPNGEPVENLIVQFQGGGICLFESDCTARFNSSPGLFDAQGDPFPDSGFLNTDNTVNPFANWSMIVNPFFEKTVRIQSEHDHQVIDCGPYAFVRHPGYVGFLGWILTTPVLLGSSWAWPPAILAAGALVVRTWLEDRTLRDELAGYADYAERVPNRLIPGVW